MTAYNSSTNDDTDVTIINHSFLYDHNDEPISTCIPILRRQQRAHQSANHTQTIAAKSPSNRSNSDGRHDYLFVDHAPLDAVKQIEQILNFYRKELKQDSNTQLDCNQQLIIRLVDFIRPVYSLHQEKMKELDSLFEEISTLHEKRFREEKEKNEQLQNKVRHLQKSIVIPPIEDENKHSLMTKLYQINSIVDYQQWIEMEEESKKLHQLVKTQRDHIDNLVELLSQRETITNESYHPIPTSASTETVEKQCSLCHFKFPITFTTDQIIQHFERCLLASNVPLPSERQQLECPYCNQNIAIIDDRTYLQHVSNCYNE